MRRGRSAHQRLPASSTTRAISGDPDPHARRAGRDYQAAGAVRHPQRIRPGGPRPPQLHESSWDAGRPSSATAGEAFRTATIRSSGSPGNRGATARSAPGAPRRWASLNSCCGPTPRHTSCAQHIMMAFSDMYSQALYQGGAFRKELVEEWLNSRPCGREMLATVRAHPHYDDLWVRLNRRGRRPPGSTSRPCFGAAGTIRFCRARSTRSS